MKTLLSGVLLALVCTTASAGVPAHSCKKPKMLSNADLGDINERKRFDRDFDAYKSCIQKYINTNGELAQAHQAAAKGAIDEINAYVKKLNAK